MVGNINLFVPVLLKTAKVGEVVALGDDTARACVGVHEGALHSLDQRVLLVAFLDFFLEVTHLLHQFQHFHFVDVLLRLLQFRHEFVDEVIFVDWVFSLFVH